MRSYLDIDGPHLGTVAHTCSPRPRKRESIEPLGLASQSGLLGELWDSERLDSQIRRTVAEKRGQSVL